MKKLILKTLYSLLFGIPLVYMVSCSEELVIIEEVDLTALDSLDNQISVTTDDLTAAKIAKDALTRRRDSLQSIIDNASTPSSNNPDVIYTVQVTDGSKAFIGGRVASLSSALVTVGQGNTNTELTTDDTGMVTFPALESGIVTLTVEIADFSDVFMLIDLRDGGADPNSLSADNRYASTQVMVFPTSGSDVFNISGVAYYDQDVDNLRTGDQNDPFHPFQGASIYETVPSGSDFQITCTPISIPLNHLRPGQILQVIYAGLAIVATTDGSGNFSIDLPAILLDNGTNFFTYAGPANNTNIVGTEVSTSGSAERVWTPSIMYPDPLGNILIFPGGNSVQDVYYFPI